MWAARGFGLIPVLILLGIVATGLAIGYSTLLQPSSSPNSEIENTADVPSREIPTPGGVVETARNVVGNVVRQTNPAEKAGKRLSNGLCVGDEKRKLGTLPMRLEDFRMIIPYGAMIGGHVTPIDHQYFSPTDFHSARDTYPVFAMADATIVDIQPRVKPAYTEYRLVFSISCRLFYYYDLVTSLAPDIKAIYERGGRATQIPVKEGQEIGRIGGQTLDFAVWDTSVVLSGFIVPEHYAGEPWKVHTVDPLMYYTDELKAQALSKYIRTTPPVSGKIDYDIDGKLVGNWFLEGTGGYGHGGIRPEYWTTHLSFAYNNEDPDAIVVSIGDFAGEPRQFGVKGNAPDPAEVSVESGIVVYELVRQDYTDPSTGEMWNHMTFVRDAKVHNRDELVLGIVLVQLVEGRKLKMEVFPGKIKTEVAGFDAQARMYER